MWCVHKLFIFPQRKQNAISINDLYNLVLRNATLIMCSFSYVRYSRILSFFILAYLARATAFILRLVSVTYSALHGLQYLWCRLKFESGRFLLQREQFFKIGSFQCYTF